MLILSRKKEESIIINDNIEITIVDIDQGQVRIGIKAPKSIEIYRKELYEDIERQNKVATKLNNDKLNKLKNIMKK